MPKSRLRRELAERYAPVSHTKEDTERLLSNPRTKAAYDALEPKYAAIHALLGARQEAGLTQAQVAERMGTTASAVARLEASLVSEKHSPSLSTLRKYADACGKTLWILLV
jgi:DNA-binding XRE family transcriptional regulator